ncbi:hypothetical protein [Nocardiopsis sp. LOL_012]
MRRESPRRTRTPAAMAVFPGVAETTKKRTDEAATAAVDGVLSHERLRRR